MIRLIIDFCPKLKLKNVLYINAKTLCNQLQLLPTIIQKLIHHSVGNNSVFGKKSIFRENCRNFQVQNIYKRLPTENAFGYMFYAHIYTYMFIVRV